MDAAEIARLREEKDPRAFWIDACSRWEATASHWMTKAHEMQTQRDAAQKDAKDARALLGEIEERCEDVDLSEHGLTHVEVILSIEVINAIRATLASGGRDARLA